VAFPISQTFSSVLRNSAQHFAHLCRTNPIRLDVVNYKRKLTSELSAFDKTCKLLDRNWDVKNNKVFLHAKCNWRIDKHSYALDLTQILFYSILEKSIGGKFGSTQEIWRSCKHCNPFNVSLVKSLFHFHVLLSIYHFMYHLFIHSKYPMIKIITLCKHYHKLF